MAGEANTGRTYGYARVSTREQNLDRQMAALESFGVDSSDVFADKASGADFERPRYRALMRKLAPGDTLVVKSIDRLGRNYDEILDEWREITRDRGVAIVVLDMPLLDTRDQLEGVTGALIGDIVLQLLSYVAQVERESIRQRQAEGIAAARARGVQFGRPRKERPEIWPKIRDAHLHGGLTIRQAAEVLGISPSTFRRWLRDDEEQSSLQEE